MAESEPTIDGRYKMGLVIACTLILGGLVFSLVIYPLYTRQMYDLARRRIAEDMNYDEYDLERNEISLWHGNGMSISRGIIVAGCFLGVFTGIALFFDRKIPLESTERLGLLILIGFLLLIAIWHSLSFYPLIPFFY